MMGQTSDKWVINIAKKCRKRCAKVRRAFCSLQKVRKVGEGNGGQEEGGRDCGNRAGDQWEGKQNKFMLRRGGSRKRSSGSGKRDMETKEGESSKSKRRPEPWWGLTL